MSDNILSMSHPLHPEVSISDDDTAMETSSIHSNDSQDSSTWVDLYNNCEMILSPFHSLEACSSRFDFVWAVENKDEFETRYVLCSHRGGPTPAGRKPEVPLLFDMVGEIAPEDCKFTAHGIPGRTVEETDIAPMASCWLKQRPNAMSEINWRGIAFTVCALVDCAPVPDRVDITTLFRTWGPQKQPQVKLIWQGFPGESAAVHLPIYSAQGLRRIPSTFDEVPFAQAFHAGFTIALYHDVRADTWNIGTNLLRIQRA